MSSTIWIVMLVVAVVAVQPFSRIASSVIGIAASGAIAWWGNLNFAKGAAIAFAGIRLSPTAFYALVGVFALSQFWGLVQAVRKRQSADDD